MIETTELYNGEIVCEFNPQRHTYTIINKGRVSSTGRALNCDQEDAGSRPAPGSSRRYKVPSVTRITSVLDKSGPLMGWAVNCTLNVCKGAIAPGVEYAEGYLEAVWKAAKEESRRQKAEAAGKGTETHRAIESFLKDPYRISGQLDNGQVPEFLQQFRAESVERRLYSRRYRYSGTLDVLARSRDGCLYLIDWKTSKSIYPEFRLQTAAYCHAFEEEFPDKLIAGRYLVRIAEDGSVEPHYFPRSTLRKDFQAFLGAKALFDRVQQIEKESKK